MQRGWLGMEPNVFLAAQDGEVVSLSHTSEQARHNHFDMDGYAILAYNGLVYAPASGRMIRVAPEEGEFVLESGGMQIVLRVDATQEEHALTSVVREGMRVKAEQKIAEYDVHASQQPPQTLVLVRGGETQGAWQVHVGRASGGRSVAMTREY